MIYRGLISLVGILTFAGAAVAQPVAIDLGTLGGRWSFPTGLNDSGHVVGYSSTSENLVRGFVWTAATGMVDLGTLGGDGSSAASGVNNRGEVVGYSSAPPLRPYLGWSTHAFLWTAAEGMIDLHASLESYGRTCFRSRAIAVNAVGQVLIECEISMGLSSPVLWTRTDGITDLAMHPDAMDMTAIALNDNGHVVGRGRVHTSAGIDSHAFLWTATEGWLDLGTLGGSRSWPSDFSLLTGGGRGSNALNTRGDVVGYSLTPVGDRHAFVWTPTDLMIDLGTLGGSRSDAYAINDEGWVVGGSYADPVLQQRAEHYHPFLWTPTNGMVDLGTLGGSNAWATDVNNQGMVVGQTSTTGNAAIRGFVWTAREGMLELPPLDGFSQSVPMILNNSGQAIGISFSYDTSPTENRHASLWLLPAPPDVAPPAESAVEETGEFSAAFQR
jgi:probable HAF family extracellular repeat protein